MADERQDVIIEKTNMFGDESIHHASPLVIVSNSFTGNSVHLNSNNVRGFSVQQAPAKPLNYRLIGLTYEWQIGWIHPFVIISQNFPSSLLNDYNFLRTDGFGERAVNDLAEPHPRVEDVFEYPHRFRSREDYYLTASRMINEHAHRAARDYAENFAVKNSFTRIVDKIKGKTYNVEDTRAFKLRQALSRSPRLEIGCEI
ncbi:hypothetical protein HYZ97_01435 [Candidatus Pacearchaeota archaeon]|nr:hypothetical protein [Candidatus Pacearchaeota archaeon]